MASDTVQKLIVAVVAKTKSADDFAKRVAAMKKATKIVLQVQTNIRKIMAEFKRQVLAAAKFARAAFRTIGGAVKGAFRGVGGIIRKAFSLPGMIAGGVLAATVIQAAHYSKAVAEIGTISNYTAGEIRQLDHDMKKMSIRFGQDAAVIAKGAYQAISSGVDPKKIQQFMAVAGKLSVGGLATMPESIDLLTNALNAYGFSADEATRVSDVFFETVRMGKTTIPQLASALGGVMPLANAAGVSIEALGAAVAALTKTGLSTPEAVTRIQGLLMAVIKQSPQAVEAANELGIAFTSDAIKAMGFANWLAHLKEKTGGSEDALRRLFARVEGLNAAISLTNNQFGEFNSILGETEKAAGASDKAFGKMAASAGFKFDQILQAVKQIGLEVGTKILGGIVRWVDHLGGVEAVFSRIKIALLEVYKTVLGTIRSLMATIEQMQPTWLGKKLFGDMRGFNEGAGKIGALLQQEMADTTTDIAMEVKSLHDLQKKNNEVQKQAVQTEEKKKLTLAEQAKIIADQVKSQRDAVAAKGKELDAARKTTSEIKAQIDLAKSAAEQYWQMSGLQRKQTMELAKRLEKGGQSEFEKLIGDKEARELMGRSKIISSMIEQKGFGEKYAAAQGVFNRLNASGSMKAEFKHQIDVNLDKEGLWELIKEKMLPKIEQFKDEIKEAIDEDFEGNGMRTANARAAAVGG